MASSEYLRRFSHDPIVHSQTVRIPQHRSAPRETLSESAQHPAETLPFHLPTSADPTNSAPLKRKRQYQEATTSSPTLDQSQLEKGNDAVLQMSEEPIQSFRAEIQRLKREKTDQEVRQSALIKGFVTFAAVLEMAVEVREAELRCGLTHMIGISEDIEEQAQKAIDFSVATSWHVSRLVKSMLDEQQLFLNDLQLKSMRRDYERAQPSQALAAIINEEMPLITRYST